MSLMDDLGLVLNGKTQNALHVIEAYERLKAHIEATSLKPMPCPVTDEDQWVLLRTTDGLLIVAQWGRAHNGNFMWLTAEGGNFEPSDFTNWQLIGE